MIRPWLRQGMRNASAAPEGRVGSYASEAAQSADQPSVANKGPASNVEPSTEHARNAESSTMGAQTNDSPPPPRRKDGAIDMQGNEPKKGAWIVNNGEWYQPTAPPPSLPAPPRRPMRRVVQNTPAVKSDRRHRRYDFSRVTTDDELSKMI